MSIENTNLIDILQPQAELRIQLKYRNMSKIPYNTDNKIQI